MIHKHSENKPYHGKHDVKKWRVVFVSMMLLLVTFTLMGRAVDLHVLNKDFLQQQGDARYLRVVPVPAHRGMITDRYGEPLAISTPVASAWANPKELLRHPQQWSRLANALQMDANDMAEQIKARHDKEFVYLKRHVTPDVVQRVQALAIPGVDFQGEYRRYYPAAEVTAHLLGFTNIDDQGQEGLELEFDDVLKGTPGANRVIKDRLGRVVETVERVSEPSPGQDIILSIDRRIQYLAYRELKAAVVKHQAESGSAVVLDAKTGEILAMVNQPAFNPNNRKEVQGMGNLRNRALTDVFEPGSTIKPFTVAAALEAGLYAPNTLIDTSPGLFRVGGQLIHDTHDYGLIDIATVIQKSSNVGASKLALSMEPRQLWDVLAGVGFGFSSGSGFPGESPGSLSDYSGWRRIETATMSFGYGLSVTALQLARAYAVFANDGYLPPVSLIRTLHGVEKNAQTSQRIFSARTARQVKSMLEMVVQEGGTGTKAKVPGYRVAGKTGTVRKVGANGYEDGAYLAVFAGMAPASKPRLVMVVMIDDPQGKAYYGGLVAAPVFSKVMAGALRILDVPPDDLPTFDGAKLAMVQE
ncbi:MAG: penicillin-binding transpeptidase domain-containing protein [Gammaproteobacteria bacterium]|jgi:cell division protein FtsI (penicillin-binding protein 3)